MNRPAQQLDAARNEERQNEQVRRRESRVREKRRAVWKA
jgi:hypothetical protein